MTATEVKDWNEKVHKANDIMERLETDPDNVSMNETFFATSIWFGKPGKPIPMSTLKKRYKKIKAKRKKQKIHSST